jgi:hypothetical protein
MADRNRHRIVRQVLELELASATRAPEFQEAAARLFQNQTLPELEALFDRMAGPDELLCVDRLELDLGTLQGPNWQEHFHTRLLQQLQRSLGQVPRSPAGPTQREAAPGDSTGIPFQQLLFFLAHGRLPWWGGQPDTGWTEALLERLDAGQWQALGVLLRSDSRAQRRLIHIVSDSLLAVILEAMTGLTQTLHVLGLLTPADLPPEQSQHWRLYFWMLLLGLVDGMPGPARGTHLMQQLLEQRGVLAQRGQPRDQGTWQGQHRRNGDTEASEFLHLPQPWQGWLEGAARERGKNQTISAEQPPRESATRSAQELRIASTTQPRASSDHTAGRAPRQEDPGREPHDVHPSVHTHGQPLEHPTAPDHSRGSVERPPGATPLQEGEAVYLGGAGVVILHPFLEELFRSRALLQGQAFRDAAAQYRAVYLLGYLTFGSDEVPEYDLLLPKLLCGLPWEEPLPPGKLTAEEHIACAELLGAVLRHWSALKSTSPAWMREQFFLRQGKLERVDANWKLTVEHHLQDVLLDKLPWGVSLIRLPWMQGLLYVRWTD